MCLNFGFFEEQVEVLATNICILILITNKLIHLFVLTVLVTFINLVLVYFRGDYRILTSELFCE